MLEKVAARRSDDDSRPRRWQPDRLILPLAAVLLGYLLWFRTHGVSESFFLRGDQIRDWSLALRRFGDLPLSGVPSTAGGTTIGPIYYWGLWAIARLASPWTNLPHAGGIGVAAAQSIADAVLFVALARRLRAAVLALTIVLAGATSGYDATLSSTIWNPPMAEALVKLAIAAVLWKREITLSQATAIVITSWCAVQCHTSAVVVAAPLILWTIAVPLKDRQWKRCGQMAALVASVIVILQTPWLIDRLRFPNPEESRITRSLQSVLAAPGRTVHVRESANLVATSLQFLVGAPHQLPYFNTILALCFALTVALVRDTGLLVASATPLAVAVLVFSLWQGRLDQAYWFLVLIPPAMITLFAWVQRILYKARIALASALLLLVLAAQPGRAQMAWSFHRLPGYGAIVAGCETIVRESRRVRDVRLLFPVPADTDTLWLFSLVGGALDAEASHVAYIDENGRVHYR
jgi:hypothetical protein